LGIPLFTGVSGDLQGGFHPFFHLSFLGF